jgi:glyoxylase-like metal-dependent hydrolase (beta-lactamase superfamily II)
MKIGDLELIPLNDGYMAASVRFSKPLPPRATSDPHCAMFRDDGMLMCQIGAFLVRSDERVLLIDAGAGPTHVCRATKSRAAELGALLREQGEPEDQIPLTMAKFARVELETGTLPTCLARAGIRREEVTDVVFTHLHFDHIGWASENGRPYFPNATYRAPWRDLQHFNGATHHERLVTAMFGSTPVPETLAPVRDRLEPWDADTTIASGVSVRVVPGHTPGNSIVILQSRDQRAMLLGDVVHCPLELMEDDFNLLSDFDQALADRAREAVARELEGTDTVISASHFPEAHFGRLLAGKGLREWLTVR